MWPFRKNERQQIATLLVYPNELWVAQWTLRDQNYLIENIGHQEFNSLIFFNGTIYNMTEVHRFLQNIVSCNRLAIALDIDRDIQPYQHFQNSLLALNSSCVLDNVMPIKAAQQINFNMEAAQQKEPSSQDQFEFLVSDCLIDKKDSKKYGKYKNEILICRGLLQDCKNKGT